MSPGPTATGRQGNGLPSLRSARLIFDPDPSLLRAGLLDGFALEHELSRVADGVDYLTGEHLVSTPFLTAFQVCDVSPLDLKRLKRLIAKHEIGTLEIKVRGAGRHARRRCATSCSCAASAAATLTG